MTKGRNRKTKKFLQFYGSDYVEKDQEEKRKKEKDREASTRGNKGPM